MESYLSLPKLLSLAKSLYDFEINSLESCLPQGIRDSTQSCYTRLDFLGAQFFAFSARVDTYYSKISFSGSSFLFLSASVLGRGLIYSTSSSGFLREDSGPVGSKP